jgi:hypothetical protein
MTIFIERQSNEAAGHPRIVCNACDHPIANFTEASAYYADPVNDDEATLTEVLYVHKKPSCQSMICNRPGFDQLVLLAVGEELGDHLVLLAARSGMSPAKYSEIYEELRQKGIITEKD